MNRWREPEPLRWEQQPSPWGGQPCSSKWAEKQEKFLPWEECFFLTFPFIEQLDALRTLRQDVRRELLKESKKHKACKLLCQIPSIGPIRAAMLLGILQTPHRFRTKRQLWTYSGFGIETRSSADHRSVEGQLRRARKPASIRGLNENHNHDLKNLFKSAAIIAATFS